LSAVASDVVAKCQKRGASDEETISTVMATLSLGTFLLGLALVGLGKLELASAVQYLPMPVVGGYLAFIGFFCGQAGLAMMSEVELLGLGDWAKLLEPRAALLAAPGLILGVGLYVLVRKARHMLALPAFLLAVVVAFYAALAIAGCSLEDARAFGWVAPRTVIGPCYQGSVLR